MKTLAKAMGLLLAALAIFAAVIVVYRIWLVPPPEDRVHLALKANYLKAIDALPRPERRPNIVVILFDDMGYGDIGAFGGGAISTPHIDRAAEQGARFTRYYAPAPNCTPSRAGMLSGRLPIHTSLSQVVFRRNSAIDMVQRALGVVTRLPTDEILLPEILRHSGYATQMIGKWHLGDIEPSLPNDFGFDDFYGVLFSNDMTPLRLYHNKDIVEQAPVDQSTLTARYTREATAFIGKNSSKPFFLYLAHNFPHIPLHASAEQKGKSDGGLYGDVVEDLDRSVGEVIAALQAHGVADNTLVLITSDNGPWFQGNPGDHRGRKNDTFDGGMAVPFIAYWPGNIAAGTNSDAMVSGLDIVPTVLDILGLPAPADRQIDGFSMKPLLLEGKPSARSVLFYNSGNELFGVRDARFKYQARRLVAAGGIEANKLGFGLPMGPWLFDLQRDPVESYDVSEKYPVQFTRLQQQFARQAAELKKNPRGWIESRSQ